MFHTKLALLSLVVLPAIASAQADTTRRRDTTRAQRDTVPRTQREARGEVDVARRAGRFSADRRNYGLSSEQAMELQRALSGAGCDAGPVDGVVGQRTRRGIDCYRRQHNISGNDLEGVITALNLSFARPDTTAAPAPARRDTSVIPPVIRQDTPRPTDTTMRRDTSTRRDTSARRDTTRRDTTRRDTTRRDTTVRRPF